MSHAEPKDYPKAQDPYMTQDSPQDSEKGVPLRNASVSSGSYPREADFATRNGLNLKSFQRRTLLLNQNASSGPRTDVGCRRGGRRCHGAGQKHESQALEHDRTSEPQSVAIAVLISSLFDIPT
jgi:hypothetical protein